MKIIGIIGSQENVGIIGANSSKTCLISYHSYAWNEIQQWRIVTGRVALPKCLFHVVTQTEKDQYTLIEQPAH